MYSVKERSDLLSHVGLHCFQIKRLCRRIVNGLSDCLGVNTSIHTVRGIVVREVMGRIRDVGSFLGGQHSEVRLVDISVSLKHGGWNLNCGLM